MKKYTLYFVCLLMMVMTVSCKKENSDKYILNARMSNFQTSKAYIDGNNYSCFRSGETIRVNNQTCTVAPNAQDSNHTCGIANVTKSDGYYAFYPAELLSDNPAPNLTGDFTGVTVTLPQTQTFEYDNTNNCQIINNPMAGHLSASSGTIPLHNLCALLKITVKATTSATISSIDVTLRGTTIWGTGSVKESDWSLEMVPQQDHSTVTLSFGQTGRQGKPTGETFYIVVPKSTVDIHTSSIQVTINGDNLDDALSHIKTYKIALSSSDNRVVAQNTIQLLPDVSIGYQMPYNQNCVFTVNAQGKKVTFAHANLMHGDKGNNTPVQYRNKWVLQGEPFHGMSRDQFTIHQTYSNSLVGDNINSDWGWVNEIITQKIMGNTPPHTWRIPTKEEWNYILFSRPGKRYAKAYVGGHCGLIIFPDGWTPINENADPYKKFVNRINITNAQYYTNITNQNISTTPTSTSEWDILANQGCIFLAAFGNSGAPTNFYGGYYATANAPTTCLYFYSNPEGNPTDVNTSKVVTNEAKPANTGVTVRLVHDLN